MNFLQLCQRLSRESGTSGTGPTSVGGQTGFSLSLVEWISTAYEDIQNMHPTWLFLKEPFSFNTAVGKRDYTPIEAGLTDLREWKTNEWGDFRNYSSVGVQDEQYLTFIPWADYKPIYLFGVTRTSAGRPTFFSVKPDKTLDFYQIPDQIFTINGEYYKQADIMEENADEPIFPDQFHLAIVWRALMHYGAFDAAGEKYSHGQNEYKKLMRKLESDQLETFTFGAPLA